jgi:hypothetical protein
MKFLLKFSFTNKFMRWREKKWPDLDATLYNAYACNDYILKHLLFKVPYRSMFFFWLKSLLIDKFAIQKVKNMKILWFLKKKFHLLNYKWLFSQI